MSLYAHYTTVTVRHSYYGHYITTIQLSLYDLYTPITACPSYSCHSILIYTCYRCSIVLLLHIMLLSPIMLLSVIVFSLYTHHTIGNVYPSYFVCCMLIILQSLSYSGQCIHIILLPIHNSHIHINFSLQDLEGTRALKFDCLGHCTRELFYQFIGWWQFFNVHFISPKLRVSLNFRQSPAAAERPFTHFLNSRLSLLPSPTSCFLVL